VASDNSEIISRTFRRYLNHYERQVFTGPPENVRDHVLASARALSEGDWRQACGFVLDLPVWDLLPNSAQVKTMLKAKLKSEALRTYLLTNAHHYDSIDAKVLCEMFELDEAEVKLIVARCAALGVPAATTHPRCLCARLVLAKDLSASWSGSCLVLLQVVPTPLQSLSVQFADKMRKLVESNEATFDRLMGSGGGGDSRRDEPRGNSSRGRGGGGGGQRGGGGGGFRRDWQDDQDRRGGGGNRGGGPGGSSNLVSRGFRADRSSRR
jgi:translation initiation factor 3 subunit C